MWLGSGQQLAKIDTDEVSLLAWRVYVLDATRNLGVIFDSQLSMSAQVSALCHTGVLVRCLYEDADKILIQPFINTWLDYCNSLYFGRADDLMSGLQSVTPPHISSPESGSASTSCQLYVSSAGCQSADKWISKYPPLSIVHWLAPLLCT